MLKQPDIRLRGHRGEGERSKIDGFITQGLRVEYMPPEMSIP